VVHDDEYDSMYDGATVVGAADEGDARTLPPSVDDLEEQWQAMHGQLSVACLKGSCGVPQGEAGAGTALEAARVETQEAKTKVGQLENQLKTATTKVGQLESELKTAETALGAAQVARAIEARGATGARRRGGEGGGGGGEGGGEGGGADGACTRQRPTVRPTSDAAGLSRLYPTQRPLSPLSEVTSHALTKGVLVAIRKNDAHLLSKLSKLPV
jgi:hypothetical protein